MGLTLRSNMKFVSDGWKSRVIIKLQGPQYIASYVGGDTSYFDWLVGLALHCTAEGETASAIRNSFQYNIMSSSGLLTMRTQFCRHLVSELCDLIGVSLQGKKHWSLQRYYTNNMLRISTSSLRRSLVYCFAFY